MRSHTRQHVRLVAAGLLPIVLWSCSSWHTIPRGPEDALRPVLGPADLEESPKLAERVWVTRTDMSTVLLLSPSVWSDSIVGSPGGSTVVPRVAIALEDVLRVQTAEIRVQTAEINDLVRVTRLDGSVSVLLSPGIWADTIFGEELPGKVRGSRPEFGPRTRIAIDDVERLESSSANPLKTALAFLGVVAAAVAAFSYLAVGALK